MSYATLKAKVEQLCETASTLKTDMAAVNTAFAQKGVQISGNDYAAAFDSVEDNYLYNVLMNGGTRARYLFYDCKGLSALPYINASAAVDVRAMFYNCQNLTTIAGLDISGAFLTTDMFFGCTSLESITFTGEIIEGINVSSCPLTVDSLMSIIGALKDLTGAESKYINLGGTNISKLSLEQLSLITDKNWSYV